MAINLPTGFFRTTNEPLDVRYLASGLTPYSSVAAANAAIESSVRYIGQFVNINNQLYWYQNGIADGNLVAFAGGGGGGSGTVTSVSVTTANGVSGTVSNPTTTPAISLSLGAITPSSVAATGTVTGSNLSGTNTGDQDLSNLVVKNPTITGATKTKITYDSKGLVTSGSDATTADIADTTNKRYQTDNQKLYNDATSSIQTQLNSKVTGVTASSPITSSGGTSPVISTSMSTNKLIGRSSAGTGSMEEITVGTGLSLSGGTLSSTSTGSGILSGTASGTDTYTVTISGVTAYNNQDAYLIRFTNGNTTGCTLNINSIGAVTLYRNNDGALIGGDIIDGAEMLCIYNSTLSGFQVIGTAPNTLLAYVTNAETSTITKGQAVYAFGGTGDRLKVKLAYNTSDATSASTLGIVLSTSIAANQKGLIIMQGQLDGLSLFPTATWADGDPVFLSSTPGGLTKTKQYAPNHLVYLGVVTTASNGSAGRMYVKVQNGYELDELHNVQAQSPNNNDTLYYDNSVSQWKTNSIAGILGYTPANASTAVTSVTGTSPISSSGGTTPAISISQATASTSGYLSSTDWTTFNNKVTSNAAIVSATKTKITYDIKGLVTAGADATTADISDSLNKRYVTDAQLVVIGNTSGVNTGDQTLSGLGGVPTSRTISTTTPLSGGGDLSANRTLSIADAVADGLTKGAATFNANDFNSAAGVISLDYTNGQAASSIKNGFLSSTDWSTFNSKQPALSGTGFVKINGTTISYDNSTYYLASNPNGYTSNLGTVTSVGLSSSTTGVTIGSTPVTTSGTISLAIATASGSQQGLLSSTDWNTFNNKQNAFGSQIANTFFAAPDGAPGVPSFRQIVAADIPTLNQNTTGSAGSVVNSLTFNNTGSGSSSGVTFNGSSAKTISYNTIGAQASSTNLTSLAALSYASTSFVKMTASGTFSLDTNTYVTSGALSSYVPYTGAVSNVALGTFSLTSDNGIYNTEISSSYFGVENNAATIFGLLEYNKLTLTDNTGPVSVMEMNTSGLVFPNGSTQTTAGLTGSGSSGQVSYWNGSTSQAGTSNLFWDSSNNRLGINNASPLYALDVSGTAKSNTVRVDNIGADTFQIFDGGGTKQLYIDSTNQFAFNAASGPIYFGAFGAPTFGRAGFSIPGNVVFVVDAVTARTGFGGGINLIFNSPDALVEIQGKADEKQLSVKGNAGQTSDIAEFKSNGTKTVYVDSTGRLVSTTMAIPTAAPASAIAGSMYIDTTTNFLWVHNGTSWVSTLLT